MARRPGLGFPGQVLTLAFPLPRSHSVLAGPDTRADRSHSTQLFVPQLAHLEAGLAGAAERWTGCKKGHRKPAQSCESRARSTVQIQAKEE